MKSVLHFIRDVTQISKMILEHILYIIFVNCYLTPVVNFGSVRRAQLAKYTLLTCTLVALGPFQIF